jgi:hypothetical protein
MANAALQNQYEATESGARARVGEFFAYWKSLPRAPGQLIPHLRSLLDSVEPRLQPTIALVDVVPPETLAVRLFGTRREAAFGSNITRANALDFYPADLRAAVFARAQCIVTQPVGWQTQRIITSTGGATVRFLSLSLPLAVDSDAAPCVANFGAAMDQQPDDNFPARINVVGGGSWIDLGAGCPALSPEI